MSKHRDNVPSAVSSICRFACATFEYPLVMICVNFSVLYLVMVSMIDWISPSLFHFLKYINRGFLQNLLLLFPVITSRSSCCLGFSSHSVDEISYNITIVTIFVSWKTLHYGFSSKTLLQLFHSLFLCFTNFSPLSN